MDSQIRQTKSAVHVVYECSVTDNPFNVSLWKTLLNAQNVTHFLTITDKMVAVTSVIFRWLYTATHSSGHDTFNNLCYHF